MANSSRLFARTRNVALALAISGVLAACGGGGGGNRTPGPIPGAVGNTLAVTTSGRLVAFDRTMGGIASSVQITGLMAGDTIAAVDLRPATNTLIGVATPSQRIYSIDTGTGAATVVSQIIGATFTGAIGIDFNPVPDALRIVTSSGQNLRVPNITPAAGATTVTAITDTGLTLNGAPALSVVGTAYNNNFGGACRTQLFYLDTANSRLLTTANPNGGVVSVVGPLGVTVTGGVTANGIDISTAANGTNTATAVVTVGGVPTVYSLNLTTGALTGAAPIAGLRNGENFVSIAFPTATATATQAAGELSGLTAANQVFTFNSAAPSKVCTGPTAIAGLGTGENVVGIDTRPANGMLYGVGVAGTTGRVFVINPATGATSAAQTINVGGTPVSVDGTNFGVDFNPVPDRLRVTSDSAMGLNLRINVTDGTTTVDLPTGARITADAYTNSLAPANPASTNLYTINSMTGTLNVQNPPNDGVQVAVGPLNITGGIGGVSGFDINGANNTAVAALTAGTATTSGLYNINLATGAATLLAGGNVGQNNNGGAPFITGAVRGIALNAIPQATLVGVTADNRVVTFAEANPAVLATNMPITGLASGENVIGIDVRPANGLLYAATSQGATYVLNPTTGAATTRVAFIPTPAAPPAMPAADPFTMLMGMNFGVDFNPVPDRLRLVSDGAMGNNLRINVANGQTLTDGNVNAGVNATAAAYTNSLPGPIGTVLATTLYTIDTASDRLNIQNPPNNGVQVDVGPLTINGVRADATDVSGFDIAGSTNFAVAVLSTVASPGIAARSATVFTIDLATGALTPIAPINVMGAVTGIALPVTAGIVDGTSTATALVNGNSLAQFTVNNPGTVASVAITGLQMGETLIGIDFRPADGETNMAPIKPLYGVGTTNRVYQIDTATGVATQLGMTITTPLDPAATSFGFDFNPVPDRLRIVSNTRQNLRLNPDTGAGVGINPDGTDARLVRADPQPALTFAAAYTNNFGLPDPARVTQLFVIDAVTNSLEFQNPPNNGTLVFRGNLTPAMGVMAPLAGVTFTGVGEFDIAGGDNGLPLAALVPTGATQSNLYRVNLGTGALTQVGATPIGPMGTPPLVGLAIILR